MKSSNYEETNIEQSKQILKTKFFLALYLEDYFRSAWMSAKTYSKSVFAVIPEHSHADTSVYVGKKNIHFSSDNMSLGFHF